MGILTIAQDKTSIQIVRQLKEKSLFTNGKKYCIVVYNEDAKGRKGALLRLFCAQGHTDDAHPRSPGILVRG